MLKILIVSYTPRVDSNTQKLLDTYLDALPSGADVEYLDLLDSPAPVHTPTSVSALLKRNFAKLPLTDLENKAALVADGYMQQLIDSDVIVFAFPMYNFSVPAAIKAWVDLVVQNDRTFCFTKDGAYEGLCHGKKALILMSSGADFGIEPNKSMNFATPYMQSVLGFLGIESHAISAFGLQQYEGRANEIVESAKAKVREYALGESSAEVV